MAKIRQLGIFLLGSAAVGAAPALADTAAATAADDNSAGQASLTEIVVTAQKRAQSLSDVPMTITAQTGAELAERGVIDTSDLGKVVSGFVYTTATFGEPVYTLRGVGLYDSGLVSAPTVSVYVDQVALPFSVMTTGASLDLERVEVLKGPQGTLFGQNNTGGAVNYIAAKPTSEYQAGYDVMFENYDKGTGSGFVSGPLSSTLNARFAFKVVEGGAWQYAIRDPNETLGNSRLGIGRLLLDWTPLDKLSVSVNLNGFVDQSDTQTSQLQAYVPGVPLPGGAFLYPNAASSPIVNGNARQANWAANDLPLRKNNELEQGSVRADYSLNDSMTLTSISAYSHMHVDSFNDIPGDQVQVESFHTFGYIKDFNQEFRLTGYTDQLHWLVGADYEQTKSNDVIEGYDEFITINVISNPPFVNATSYSEQVHDIYAAFANVEYKILPPLTLQGGARFTQTNQRADDCSHDLTPGSPVTAYFNTIAPLLDPANTPVGPYQCYAFNPFNHYQEGSFHDSLNQGNLSYRVSADYAFDSGLHTYASVSRGYKAGLFSNTASSTDQQNLPVKEERLDAYEVGIKATFADNRARFNAAGFYYDYTDKQLRARILDPVFALLETLVTVPKSQIYGIDADLQLVPIQGLTFTLAATYLHSDINQDFITSNGVDVYDEGGHHGNFKGSRLPYTPEATANADVQYEWALNSKLNAFTGAGLTFHGNDNTTLQANGAAPDANFAIKAYTLLDLRAGLASPDKTWRAELFGRNVTNKYYTTANFQATDTRFQYAGLPATYGIEINHTF